MFVHVSRCLIYKVHRPFAQPIWKVIRTSSGSRPPFRSNFYIIARIVQLVKHFFRFSLLLFCFSHALSGQLPYNIISPPYCQYLFSSFLPLFRSFFAPPSLSIPLLPLPFLLYALFILRFRFGSSLRFGFAVSASLSHAQASCPNPSLGKHLPPQNESFHVNVPKSSGYGRVGPLPHSCWGKERVVRGYIPNIIKE